MKLNLFVLILFISGVCNAQLGSKAPWMDALQTGNRSSVNPKFEEIVDSFESYWSDKDETKKGSGYKPFKRWESLYKSYLNDDGTVMKPSQLWSAWASNNATRSSLVDESNWTNIGPLTHTNTGSWSAGQGRVNAMAVDPNNSAILYVGTPAGGLWQSIDSGNTWSPLTDDLPQIGVSGIAIDPNNSDVIYIATGDDDAGDSYSVGVMKSLDGGLSWNTTGLNVNNSPSSMNDIIIDPANSQKLWLATSQGIFMTLNGGETWENVRSGRFQDLKIKPGSSTVIYAATPNSVFKSNNGGNNWENISTGFISGAARIVLDVTPANPNVLYAFKSDSSFGAGEIFKSDDNGNTFIRTYNGNPNIFESTQAWFDMAFAVSDVDEDEIYTGVLNIWKSNDSGASFTQLNSWSSPNEPAYTHADIHNLKFINNILYCGSDGGFYASSNQGQTFQSFTDGLAIGQFYKIDVAETDPSLITGGLQDNGGYARNNGIWQNYYGADGMENVFDPQESSKIYGFTQSGGGLYYSETGGGSNDGSFNGPEDGNWITPLAFSKDNRLYAAYKGIYELDFCSNSWVQLSLSFNDAIDQLETDPNNSNVMYISIGGSLRRSTNGGSNFYSVQSFSQNITSIEVNNNNSNIIYIVTGGVNGRVFKGEVSNDTYEFSDITGSLPSIPKLVIKHQNYEANNPLFLGTALGVWKYDDTVGDWESFQNNLPNTAVRDLDVNEKNGILTAGTYGRGIWQTAIDFTPITSDVSSIRLVSVNNQVVGCSEVATSITFRNNGTTNLTTAMINYQAGDVSTSVEWNGNLAPDETTSLELPTLGLSNGSYVLTAQIISDEDQIIENNTISMAIYVNEEGEGDMLNDFETTEGDLLVIASNSNENCVNTESVWQRGVPTGTLLNSATSGSNVYGTNLSGNHPDNVKEYLTTKCYDISSLDVPVISFNMAFDLELDWDILYLEYTTNDGENWNILGTASDENWYNSDTTPSNNCYNCPGAQWTGTNATMTNYSYDLSDFASETSMLFRFVFHSDQNTNQEGVVIDDLEIGQAPLSAEEVHIDGLSIYPNPSIGLFTINWSENSSVEFEVFDILGKSITGKIDVKGGLRSYPIDLSNYAAGLYLLKINTDQKQITKKLILK